MVVADGNEVVAGVAYRLSDVIAVYPITPSTPMGELADQWSDEGRANVMGRVPLVIEMHSEGGVAGAVHGSLQAGALTTTFTASQGLLLMIPAMYKIAGELTPAVFHVAARSLAAQALSIFGDHSDVMAARATGFAMLSSGSVQEAGDLALVAHAATLEARVPFIHFFDGFRTSHEINKVAPLDDATLREMLPDGGAAAHLERALNPARPFIRGTAQNPDTYFQGRESVNRWYDACPGIVQAAMDRFAALTGRQYRLFDYAGHPEADTVIVVMGSGGETAEETVRYMSAGGDRVGVVRVRLYRPFDAEALCAALPSSVTRIAVLDRTKEPGGAGEPLYLDIVAALQEQLHQEFDRYRNAAVARAKARLDESHAALAAGNVRFCAPNTGRDSARYFGEVICFTDGTVAASASGATIPEVTLLVQGSQEINMPDNIAYQASTGNWIVHEDGSTVGAQGGDRNNDLWSCLEDGTDIDSLTDGCVRIGTLNDLDAEWTGGFFDPSGKHFYVSVQHNSSGFGTTYDRCVSSRW